MSLFSFKLLCLLFILFVSILAGWYPFVKKIKVQHAFDMPVAEALEGGIFLGAGLIHMLGDAAHGFFSAGYVYPAPFFICGLTFLLLLLIEHVGRDFYQEHKETAFVILTLVMLSIHSLLEGLALGLSDTFSVGILILFAIGAHKWAASFALAVELNKRLHTFKKALYGFIIFALMTPVGIMLGGLASSDLLPYPMAQATFMAMAAGTFLYLGTMRSLAYAYMVKERHDLATFLLVLLGFLIMAVVAIWA